MYSLKGVFPQDMPYMPDGCGSDFWAPQLSEERGSFDPYPPIHAVYHIEVNGEVDLHARGHLH